jgi:hypothetical protein
MKLRSYACIALKFEYRICLAYLADFNIIILIPEHFMPIYSQAFMQQSDDHDRRSMSNLIIILRCAIA